MRRRDFMIGLGAALLPSASLARDTANYWSNKPPKVREWLKGAQVPGGLKGACCDEADGKPCLEDIKDGEYQATLPLECYTDPRAYAEPKEPYAKPVPEKVIIRPNMAGEPVAWITYVNGKIEFRCYSPGGGV